MTEIWVNVPDEDVGSNYVWVSIYQSDGSLVDTVQATKIIDDLYKAEIDLEVGEYIAKAYIGDENKNLIEDIGVYILRVPEMSEVISDINSKTNLIKKYLANRWKIENNKLIIYDDDKVTPILVFDLYDKDGNPTEVNVYDRVPE